jgi:hypothetical protein
MAIRCPVRVSSLPVLLVEEFDLTRERIAQALESDGLPYEAFLHLGAPLALQD